MVGNSEVDHILKCLQRRWQSYREGEQLPQGHTGHQGRAMTSPKPFDTPTPLCDTAFHHSPHLCFVFHFKNRKFVREILRFISALKSNDL